MVSTVSSCCAILQILVLIQYQINTGPLLTILILIILNYKGSFAFVCFLIILGSLPSNMKRLEQTAFSFIFKEFFGDPERKCGCRWSTLVIIWCLNLPWTMKNIFHIAWLRYIFCHIPPKLVNRSQWAAYSTYRIETKYRSYCTSFWYQYQLWYWFYGYFSLFYYLIPPWAL